MTVLQRVDLDSINRQARDVKFSRTVLLIIAALLFGTFWCLAKLLGVLWLAAAWTYVASREGWREGIKGTALVKARA